MNAYNVTLTLQFAAGNPSQALRLAKQVGQDIEHSHHRAARKGLAGVTHAWVGKPAAAIEWCEQAGCPREQCVACKEQQHEQEEEATTHA